MKKLETWAKEKFRDFKTSFFSLPLNRKFLWIFAGISVFLIGWYFIYIYLFFAWGKNLVGPDFLYGSLFFQDVSDAFMDFYNINFMVLDNDPYFVAGDVGGGSSYPPLILTVAKLFAFIGGTAETSRGLRLTFRGVLSGVLYFAIFFVGAWFLLSAYAKKNGFTKKETIWLYVALLLSAPMLYLIDRGNYLTYTVLCLGLFFLWKEETGKKREVSYLALALAVAFKLYPAVFAFLLLRKKDFMGFWKVVLYSVVLCIVPLLFFKNGMMNVVYFFQNLFKFSTEPYSFLADGVRYQTGMANDLAVDNLVKVFALLVSGISCFDLPMWVSPLALGVRIGFVFVTIGGIFLARDEWGSVLSASTAVLLLPSPSFAYTASLMIFPFLFFLKEERFGKRNLVYFLLLLCSLMTLDLGFMLPTWSHGLQHGYATINFVQGISACALSILIFSDGLDRFSGMNNDKKTFS